jgi:hypothetical protein
VCFCCGEERRVRCVVQEVLLFRLRSDLGIRVCVCFVSKVLLEGVFVFVVGER